MPALLTDRSLNVAVPLAADLVRVPPSVPGPAFVPKASVTLLPPVTMLPPESCTWTVTDGVIVAPVTVVEGPTPKTSLAAGPRIVNWELGLLAGRAGAVAINV